MKEELDPERELSEHDEQSPVERRQIVDDIENFAGKAYEEVETESAAGEGSRVHNNEMAEHKESNVI